MSTVTTGHRYGEVGVVSRVLNLVWLFTQFAGFAVALAGISILQSQCNANSDQYNFNGFFGLGLNSVQSSVNAAGGMGNAPSGTGNTDYNCGMQYSWYWWVVFFQFAVTIAGILGNFSGLRYGRSGINSFYAVAISQWAIFAYPMIYMVYLYQAWGRDQTDHNLWGQGYICGAAGAIICLVGDFLFLMTFGYDDSLAALAYNSKTTGSGPVIVEHTPAMVGTHDPHVHVHNTGTTIV